jgi:hypothetical protein
MRHAIGFGVLLLLVATGEGHAAGNQPFCLEGLWVSTGSMSTARVGHRATLLPSGEVLVVGGLSFTGPETPAELYDPAAGTWSPTGDVGSSPGQADHTLTLLPTRKVLVAGGTFPRGLILRSANLYDADTGQFTTTGAMLDARYSHTATLLPTGKVLVVGGEGPFDPPGSRPLASAELYDPATGQWHATGALSNARAFHTATLLASSQVLVLGGLTPTSPTTDAEGPTSSAELYDPQAGTWAAAAPMLAARAGHTATLLLSGAVLVAGGGGIDPSVPMEAELYDPVAGTWHRTGSLSASYAGHTATRLPSGRVLVVGASGGIRNTELFDPGSETWSEAGCTVDTRFGHTATLLFSGGVLVAGGFGSSGRVSSAELYGIIVSPAQVSLAPGTSQTFTARGGSGFDYVWSFKQNNSGGTLTASGVYHAGAVGGVTDIVQVVDSFANSATATVNVTQQAVTVSATNPHANSMGCGTTGGAALPSLAGAVVVLLGWTAFRRREAREDSCSRRAAS